MFFSRYLYEKVKKCKKRFLYIVLNQNEIDYLNRFDIDCRVTETPGVYCINCNKLKRIFGIC